MNKTAQELATLLHFHARKLGYGFDSLLDDAAAMLDTLPAPAPEREKIVELPSKYALMGMIEDAAGNADTSEEVINFVYTIISPYLARGKE